jgi:hypothetical protein
MMIGSFGTPSMVAAWQSMNQWKRFLNQIKIKPYKSEP